MTRPMQSSPARNTAACRIESAPEANGRPAVRATIRSILRSHMSFTTQPALRMTTEPMPNSRISRSVSGQGARASRMLHKPGRNSSQAPIGRSSRARIA